MRRQAILLAPASEPSRATAATAQAPAVASRSDSFVSIRGAGGHMVTTSAPTTTASTATGSAVVDAAAGSSSAQQNHGQRFCAGRSVGPGGGSIAILAGAAAAFSLFSTALFLAAVTTGAWESVAFNFAAVNASHEGAALSLVTRTGELAGAVLPPRLIGNRSTKSACLLDLRGGLWSVCSLVDQANEQNRARFSAHCQASSPMRNASCFSYIVDGGALRAGPGQPVAERSQPQSQIMKMQNNTISCCIVVMLCILASVVTGSIGVGVRVVPSITVTGVLYLTAGIFASFGNSIEHEKIARMSRKPRTCVDCTCYSLVKTPEEYCSSAYRSVRAGWSLIPSWASALAFLISSIFWLCLSRSVRIQKSKSML